MNNYTAVRIKKLIAIPILVISWYIHTMDHAAQSMIPVSSPTVNFFTIHDAVRAKNTHRVTQLLDANPENVNSNDLLRQTPLLLAVKNNDKPMVTLLISRNAKVTQISVWASMYYKADVEIVATLLTNFKHKNNPQILQNFLNHACATTLENMIENTTNIHSPLYRPPGERPEVYKESILYVKVLKYIVEAAKDKQIQQESPRSKELDTVRLLLSYGASLE